MKKMTKLLCLLMIFVLLPVWAQAGYVVDETTFNKTCEWRMSSSSTLYKGTAQDTDEGVVYTFESIGTLSAGKYVVPLFSENGKTEVFYWSGGRQCAWVDSEAISSARRAIYATNGNKGHIPALAWGDEAAVRYFLSEYWSAEDVQSFIDGMNQGLTGENAGTTGGTTNGETGGATTGGTTSGTTGGTSGGTTDKKEESNPVAVVKKEALAAPTITLQLSEEEAPEVDMVLPGVARSTVLLEAVETIVPTADLRWDAGEAEHLLAVIYAPNTGLASLYARDEGQGGAIKKLKAGSVVMVLGVSGKYTKVYGENTVGYVITSALEFHDPCPDAVEATVAGKTNLRLTARDNGRKLIELPEGATVMLIREDGKWAFVEYEGFAGYMETGKLEK